MKALVCNELGEPDVLKLEESPGLTPAAFTVALCLRETPILASWPQGR